MNFEKVRAEALEKWKEIKVEKLARGYWFEPCGFCLYFLSTGNAGISMTCCHYVCPCKKDGICGVENSLVAQLDDVSTWEQTEKIIDKIIKGLENLNE